MKFDRVEIVFIWALLSWLTPLTDEGEEETGVPRKRNPDDELEKRPHTKGTQQCDRRAAERADVLTLPT